MLWWHQPSHRSSVIINVWLGIQWDVLRHMIQERNSFIHMNTLVPLGETISKLQHILGHEDRIEWNKLNSLVGNEIELGIVIRMIKSWPGAGIKVTKGMGYNVWFKRRSHLRRIHEGHYYSPEHPDYHWSESVSIMPTSFSNRRKTHLSFQWNLILFWIQRKHQRIEKRELKRIPGESEGCLEWYERCLGSSGVK
jgi:hypothetical protein